jgi:hypothetical protein
MQRLDTRTLVVLREALARQTMLFRLLALVAPTNKLARVLAGLEVSLHEIRLRSLDQSHGGLLCRGSRETSRTQETGKPGGFYHATSPLSR